MEKIDTGLDLLDQREKQIGFNCLIPTVPDAIQHAILDTPRDTPTNVAYARMTAREKFEKASRKFLDAPTAINYSALITAAITLGYSRLIPKTE